MNAFTISDSTFTRKTISFCVKTRRARLWKKAACSRNAGPAAWVSVRHNPGGDDGSDLFSGWIYDTLKPYGEQLEMAHPAKMKSISAGKKKSDTSTPAPSPTGALQSFAGCYVAAPRIRELRAAALSQPGGERSGAHEKQMAGLLMETGALYVKEKLHRKNTSPVCWKNSKMPES